MFKKALLPLVVSLLVTTSFAQTAKWIYYPGDFEIWLHKELSLRRTERNQAYPTMWRIDPAYGIASFSKRVSLEKPEKAVVYADGKFHVRLMSGQVEYGYDNDNLTLPAGEYNITVVVENFNTVPSIWFSSESIKSDETWSVNVLNGESVSAAAYNSSDPAMPPSSFSMSLTPMECKIIDKGQGYVLYDFGKNTFGHPIIHGLKGEGKINLYYGESIEEAMAGKLAETWDEKVVNTNSATNDTLPTKAFRYVKIENTDRVSYSGLSMLYEYLPVEYKGKFLCSDTLLNRIYETAMYTLHLNTRECHLDGIKRDRWVWSGDAMQSYLMNFYSFFDEDVNKRTFWGLRGHSPVMRHMNTILDYSFYWIIGLEYHYNYTADQNFIRQIYPRMKETMDFCIGRLNANGVAEGMPGDWVFIDWAPIDKSGEISFEQLLFIKSLLSMRTCADIAGDKETAERMTDLYNKSMRQFDELFWSEQKKAYIHSRINGKQNDNITRYTNMFAILFDMVGKDRQEAVKNSVILNPDILQITTPYMKFYELAALCQVGEHEKVLEFLRSYWGGMLKLGATTFWEEYNPELKDNEHLPMYGRPFGKSLCHAWGANPVYLMGRYYLGAYPTEPGYKKYRVEPNMGGLQWIEGSVPTPMGGIDLRMDKTSIKITTPANNGGELVFRSKTKPVCKEGTITSSENGVYVLALDSPNKTYNIKYRSLE